MSTSSPLSFYLLPHKQQTVFTATVASTPSDPYMTISYSSGQTGSFGSPLPGQTVFFGTSAGGSQRGKVRLRSWSPAGTSGTISIAESDDLGPRIQSGDHITILRQWRLFPIYPRTVQVGTDVQFFEDYDIVFTNQTIQWRPVAVAGPPAVILLSGGTAQAKFIGDQSFALADSATLTGYLWTALGSTEGSSASQGTQASPVTFTYTSPGQYLVYLTVTDSNGNTGVNYTTVWVIDPTDPASVAITAFDNLNDSFDFEGGGGQAGFVVHDRQATIADFPAECQVVVACNGDLTTPAGWPFRNNILFNGYVIGDSVRQNPREGDVSFRTQTLDGVMRNLKMFPVSLTDKVAPADWTMAKNLTTDRAASFLWLWRSTLSLMAPIVRTTYSALIARQDFGPSDLFSQLQNELLASIGGGRGKLVVNHQGVVCHTIDYNTQTTTERALTANSKTLQKGIWVDDVSIEERSNYGWPVSQVKMSGVYYPGNENTDVCPLFSEAPGDAPKVYGRELAADRQILLSQDELNERCGLLLAKETEQYPAYRMRFINDASFQTVPQVLFPAVIQGADNDRGLTLSPTLIPRRLSRMYSNELGYYAIDVEFEPVTTGPDGVTVNLPCGPPEQKLETPPLPPDISGPTSLALSNLGTSFYFAEGVLQTMLAGDPLSWQRRVNGLDGDQLAFQDMVPDEWSTFKNGYNIEHIILWGCGASFLARTETTGTRWFDRTIYLDDPPNSWGDATGSSVSDLTLKQVLTNVFIEDEAFVLAQATATGSAYRGWIYKTSDGFNYTPYALTGTSQALPLRMDLDKGEGKTLWVTAWEGDNAIYLRKYAGATMALSNKYTIVTGVAVASVLDHTYTAYPLAPLGDKDVLYLYGRMAGPLVAGTVAIMRSDDAAANWSSVVNDWSGDYCGALWVSEAEANGDRFVHAVRQNDTDLPPVPIAFGAGTYTAVTQLSTTRALVAYSDINDKGQFRLIDTTTNPPTLLDQGALPGGNIDDTYLMLDVIDSNHAAVAYRAHDNNLAQDAVQVGIIDVTGDTLSVGTPVAIALVAGTDVGLAVLSTTKAVVTYSDGSDSLQGKGAVVDLDTATDTVTPNAVQTFRAASVAYTACAKVDSSTAVVFYRIAAGLDLNANVLDAITGTSWTLGADTVADNTNSIFDNVGYQYAINIDSTRVLAAYQYRTTPGSDFIIRAICGTVSGSTITFGSTADLTDGAVYDERPVVTLTASDTVKCLYGNLSSIRQLDLTLSGTAISGGSSSELIDLPSGEDYFSINGSLPVVVYVDTDDSNIVKAIVL